MHLKKIKKNPNYNRTAAIAKNFMISQKLNKLPTNPFELAKNNGWMIEKASEVAADLDLSVYYLLNKLIKTKDGASIYSAETEEFKIIYNDYIRSKGRIRWTLTHEIGHIVLGHHEYKQTKIYRGGLEEEQYEALEKEADFFASLILAPPVVLHKLNVNSPKEVRKICKLSAEASKNRFSYYLRWKNFIKDKKDQIIASNFSDFINKKKCKTCGHIFVSESAKYCPICGNENFEWGKGKMKYNDFIELNDKGRANICPNCDNEDIGQEDKYCKICGSYLYQECQNNCDVILDSNARHCTQCGSPTTFLENDYLDHWTNENNDLDESLNELEKEFADDEFDVPF
jgi:Zn-dependent peptidase ImmA (M78 family)